MRKNGMIEFMENVTSSQEPIPTKAVLLSLITEANGTKYSRMDQVKFVADSL